MKPTTQGSLIHFTSDITDLHASNIQLQCDKWELEDRLQSRIKELTQDLNAAYQRIQDLENELIDNRFWPMED